MFTKYLHSVTNRGFFTSLTVISTRVSGPYHHGKASHLGMRVEAKASKCGV